MSEPVCIVSMGARTPVGHDAWAMAAAVRAGISGFSEHPAMIDTEGEPMRVACVEGIDVAVRGVDRFEALLFPALDAVTSVLAQHRRASVKTAIVLALPAQRPGLPDDLPGQLMARIQQRYASCFASAAVFATGHAAGLMGLDAACQKLRQGALDACVLAGVDSYMDPQTLTWVEACDQLHGAGKLNNAWGFIPGEAGATLLLVRESIARQLGLTPLGVVLGSGVAFEPKRIKTETVCIGEGLTEAFRRALTAMPAGMRITDVYCDMNGEPYRADEYGFAALRTKEHFASATDFIAPADCVGDVAAAGALLHLQLACIAGHKRYGKGPLAFAWASAEAGERAAALVAVRHGD